MAALSLVAATLPGPAAAVAAVHPSATAMPAAPTASAVSGAPADLIRSREWSLAALHIPQAWRWSKGAGVTVAVLDTGVDGRHPDLTGRVIQGPDYTGKGRRPGNRYWGRHGTAMASIIAGHGHGPGRTAGIVGVAPQAKILSIRVTWENDDPERSDRTRVNRTKDAVAKGIRYAADHGAQVINMSLGGGKMIYNGNPVEEEAVRYALSKGAMLIASAGNDGAGLNRTNFPAAYPGVTAVGAVDKALRPAKFTNRHDYVSVAAPGVDIISADAGRSYVQGTGTSPSAAIVAGIAALVRARCPALSPEQTRQALEEGTTHRPPGGRNTKVGTGVADALKAVYAGNRLCKAPPPTHAVQHPPEAAGAAVRAHASLPRIGFLGGGGLLLIVSLFMGWRQRRRRARETQPTYDRYDDGPDDSYDDGPDDPPPPEPARPDRLSRPGRQVHPVLPGGSAMPIHAAPVVEVAPPMETAPPPMETAPRQRRATPGRRPTRLDESSWSPHRPGLLAAPVVPVAPPLAPPPEPRRPAPTSRQAPAPERDFGDDPLGTGHIEPTFEASTPLADQSWEIVLRDRRRDDPTRAVRPNEYDGNGGRPPAGGEPEDPFDFPRFESRFRRPPES
ncbi:MAG TPA: S8 family serine peptidase [Streptosporangiaceae bacterium]|nr:S8 family serine peptidase [Streptosporangiaceae bacterium]